MIRRLTENRFLQRPFDIECLDLREPDEYRTVFQTDSDRIIYSSAFRRLQAKTQVFLSGEFDFYRTRLTHSLEVAQIGRSISSFLKQTSPFLNESFFIDPDLVEGICLTHDLGHSPFGHAGERTLHQLMKQFGGFEGNAQSLRIIYRNDLSRPEFAPRNESFPSFHRRDPEIQETLPRGCRGNQPIYL